MGSRGASSGAARTARAKNSVFGTEKPYTFQGTYMENGGMFGRGAYKETVLEMVDKQNGDVELQYATPVSRDKGAKTNKTVNLTYELKAGFIGRRSDTLTHNINWDNIKSFSGETYAVRDELKKHGFRWDGGKRRWVKG